MGEAWARPGPEHLAGQAGEAHGAMRAWAVPSLVTSPRGLTRSSHPVPRAVCPLLSPSAPSTAFQANPTAQPQAQGLPRSLLLAHFSPGLSTIRTVWHSRLLKSGLLPPPSPASPFSSSLLPCLLPQVLVLFLPLRLSLGLSLQPFPLQEACTSSASLLCQLPLKVADARVWVSTVFFLGGFVLLLQHRPHYTVLSTSASLFPLLDQELLVYSSAPLVLGVESTLSK